MSFLLFLLLGLLQLQVVVVDNLEFAAEDVEVFIQPLHRLRQVLVAVLTQEVDSVDFVEGEFVVLDLFDLLCLLNAVWVKWYLVELFSVRISIDFSKKLQE